MAQPRHASHTSQAPIRGEDLLAHSSKLLNTVFKVSFFWSQVPRCSSSHISYRSYQGMLVNQAECPNKKLHHIGCPQNLPWTLNRYRRQTPVHRRPKHVHPCQMPWWIWIFSSSDHLLSTKGENSSIMKRFTNLEAKEPLARSIPVSTNWFQILS